MHIQKEQVFGISREFHLNQFSAESKENCCHTLSKKKNFFSVIILWPNFFVMNWTWISYFIKATIIQMEYTLTHQMTDLSQTLSKGDWHGVPKTLPQNKWSSMVVKQQNQLAKCQNGTQCSQTVLNSRQMSEPIGKNDQIALHVHKWSSVVDRRQN